ncbi:MAG: hypothetical protein H6719_08645 [Sandaracinaceae bacterium]|nr:hypothetical protein [Sandaracinaceae bacterium]
MRRRVELAMQDSALDPDRPDDRRIEHRRFTPKGRMHYRVFLYLVGPDLPFVRDVVYELHPTFAQRTRRVRRTLENPSCKLEIWTWGTFEIRATVHTKDAGAVTLTHDMRYPGDFDAPDVQLVSRDGRS